MRDFLAYFSVAVLLICHVDCIMFHLHPNTYKCLKEDMNPNQLIVGEYEVQSVPGQTVDYVVCLLKCFQYSSDSLTCHFRPKIPKDTF